MSKWYLDEKLMYKIIDKVAELGLIPKEELLETYNSKKNFEIIGKADEVLNNFNERGKVANSLYEKYNIPNVTPEIARAVSVLIDISGTPEAEKKNVEILMQASTLEGSKKIQKEFTQKMFDLDTSKYIVKFDGLMSYADIALNNYVDGYLPFVCCDFIKEKDDFNLHNAISFLQDVGVMNHYVQYLNSPLAAIIPDKYMLDRDKMETITISMMYDLPKLFSADEKNTPDFQKLPDYTASLLAISQKFKVFNKYAELKDNKILNLENGCLKSGYFTLDGKKDFDNMKLEDSIVNGRNVNLEFVKYTEKEINEIEIKENSVVNRNFVKDEDGKYTKFVPVGKREILRHATEKVSAIVMEKDGNKFDKFLDNFKKTHSVFSRDTEKFKNMEKSLKDVSANLKLFTDGRHKSDYPPVQMEEDCDKFLSSLIELKENVDKYIVYKTDDVIKRPKSSRGKDRLEIAGYLKSFVDDLSAKYGISREMFESFEKEKQGNVKAASSGERKKIDKKTADKLKKEVEGKNRKTEVKDKKEEKKKIKTVSK